MPELENHQLARHREHISKASISIHNIPVEQISAWNTEVIASQRSVCGHGLRAQIDRLHGPSTSTQSHGYGRSVIVDMSSSHSIYHCGLLILHDTANKDTRTKQKPRTIPSCCSLLPSPASLTQCIIKLNLSTQLLNELLHSVDGALGASRLGNEHLTLLVNDKDTALGAFGDLLEADGTDERRLGVA